MLFTRQLLSLFLFYISFQEISNGQCFQNTTDPASFQLYNTAISPRGIVLADFNNDGKADLASVSQIQHTISIRYNDQHGLFGSSITFPVGITPIPLVAADFNGDNRIDLAVGNTSGTVSMLLNSENGFTGFPEHILEYQEFQVWL
ncbi:hypothetical protein GO730_38770 [Spirosoma sp. HMF3257]|uniref:VCBS repeat-containing protein n=1 Tax=Spirosoma telluris TaxID=2183553 RepID=A0A327NFV8_9BACT|nr:hypothetical protein [Spirosoma telluris]RAI72846.1 hypothetical protein HMF3257_38695 [Spirosoma telluris]